MDGEALRTFVAIHRAGGITPACDALHLSQPAVSRRLAVLERALAVPLFERTAGGMVLTVAGEVLLPYAESALATLEDAERAVRAVHTEAVGAVRMAVVGTLASTDLTVVLRGLAERHPGVQLLLRTATSQEVSDLVRRGDAVIGLRYGDDPDPALRSERLFDERMVVVAAPDHPMARRPCAAVRALGAERWLAFPDAPGRPEAANRYVRQTLEAAGVAEDQILRVDSLTAQKRLVEAGFGIALLPVSAIREEQAAGSLSVLDVAGLDVAVPVHVVTRSRGYLGAAARTLLDGLRGTGAQAAAS